MAVKTTKVIFQVVSNETAKGVDVAMIIWPGDEPPSVITIRGNPEMYPFLYQVWDGEKFVTPSERQLYLNAVKRMFSGPQTTFVRAEIRKEQELPA